MLQIDPDDLEHLGYAVAYDRPPRQHALEGYEISRGINNHKRRYVREEIIQLFSLGYSNRSAAKILNISKTTTRLLRRKLALKGEVFLCLCGQASTHQGWCSWRFQRSEARQKFMRVWHAS